MAAHPVDGTRIECAASDGFAGWLSTAPGSVALSTYQAGKLALIGWDGQRVSLLLRQFDKPMGLAVHGSRLAMATRNEVTLFANAPQLAWNCFEEDPGRYDGLLLPRTTYHTGDLNVHDLGFGRDGMWIVNTRFSCLAGLSHDYCFVPRWKPPFITELAPEDRCHMNGMAMVDGEPKYVTALGTTDVVGGWRANKAKGGVLMEVPSGEIVIRGLAMPHSPRWHDGAVWFLNSGAGQLCRYKPGDDGFDVVCQVPAYLRGLCLVGRTALVGMSQIREKHIFGDLPVQTTGQKLLCGVTAIDLTRGVELGRFEFTAGATETYDVRLLESIRKPGILNLQMEQTRQAFPAPEFSYWLRPSAMIADHSNAPPA